MSTGAGGFTIQPYSVVSLRPTRPPQQERDEKATTAIQPLAAHAFLLPPPPVPPTPAMLLASSPVKSTPPSFAFSSPVKEEGEETTSVHAAFVSPTKTNSDAVRKGRCFYSQMLRN
jgi:hypothetical protein